MVAMNEIIFIEGLIDGREVFSPHPYDEIRKLSSYCNYRRMNEKESIEFIVNTMKERTTDFNYDLWIEHIEKNVKKAILKNYTPKEVDCVEVYNEEFELLKKIDNRYERKLLFTLIVLARLRNILVGRLDNKEKVNGREVAKIANLTSFKKSDLNKLYFSLRSKGFINFYGSGKEPDKIIVYKMIAPPKNKEEIKFSITKLDGLGNMIDSEVRHIIKEEKKLETEEKRQKRYEKLLKKVDKNGNHLYKKCEHCSKPYKPKEKDFSSKYCSSCKEEKNKEKYARYNEKRKKL